LSSDRQVGDKFGVSVSISADGNAVIVGATFLDVGESVDQGAAFVFTRSNATWTELRRLTEMPGRADGHFGVAAISGDGQTAIIGAPASANQGPSPAYIFIRNSGGLVDAGDGKVDIRAADLDIQGTISSANIVSLATSHTGRLIDVGTDTIDSFGLTVAELARITTGTLQIGDTNSGPIIVSADITRAAATHVTLTSGSSISVANGAIDTAGGDLLLAPGGSSSVTVAKAGNDVNLWERQAPYRLSAAAIWHLRSTGRRSIPSTSSSTWWARSI
jgi:hypothetical protein